MDYAVIHGRDLLAEAYGDLSEPRPEATCPACGFPVYYVGSVTPETMEHFSHTPGTGAPDDCTERSSGRLDLANYDYEAVEATDLRIKAETDAAYQTTIEEYWRASCYGSFDFAKELSIRLARADKKKLWYYNGLSEENLPLLLLCLCDLNTTSKGLAARYRYRLRKGRNNSTFRPSAAVPHHVDVFRVFGADCKFATRLPRANPIPFP